MASDQGSHDGEAARRDAGSRRSRWWLLLLLLPYAGLLYPALYDSLRPWVFGFPFFLWYQFLWVFIGVAITFFVYKITD